MNNRSLLDSQLERLERVTTEIASSHVGSALAVVKAKRASLVMQMYDDLAQQGRYRKAVFFLANDLLGDNNLAERGGELKRAKSAMVKMMPDALLGTLARSVEFTAVTLEIEYVLAKYLDGGIDRDTVVSDDEYISSVRSVITQSLFEEQSGLIIEIGNQLKSVVRKPFVSTALKMCRKPAQLMGLADLQDFLERGFDAFQSMRGAEEFLRIFKQRESELLDKIYHSAGQPG